MQLGMVPILFEILILHATILKKWITSWIWCCLIWNYFRRWSLAKRMIMHFLIFISKVFSRCCYNFFLKNNYILRYHSDIISQLTPIHHLTELYITMNKRKQYNRSSRLNIIIYICQHWRFLNWTISGYKFENFSFNNWILKKMIFSFTRQHIKLWRINQILIFSIFICTFSSL